MMLNDGSAGPTDEPETTVVSSDTVVSSGSRRFTPGLDNLPSQTMLLMEDLKKEKQQGMWRDLENHQ